MKYTRKKSGKVVTINSWKVTGGKDGIVISWDSPELGFGEYTILNHPTEEGKFVVESECMDSLPDLDFLKAVLGAIVENVVEVRG